jgi:hypothetical protein
MIAIIIYIIILFIYELSYIKFCNSEEIKLYIQKDKDNYVKNLSKIDLYARKVKSPDEYKNLIINNVDDFNLLEKCKLVKAIYIANKFTHPELNAEIFNKIIWKIAKIKGNIYENGYPHTRSDIIFINDSYCKMNICLMAKTLIHEKIHLYQRLYPELVKNYMKKFKKIKRKTELTRSNPDLDEYIYMFNNEEMNAEYNSSTPYNIGDIKINNSSYEHPHEYMAYDIVKNFKCL